MNIENSDAVKEILDAQHGHWEDTLSKRPSMFGEAPSEAARKAADLFKQEAKKKILELGAGQGRDTLYFAQNGFQVWSLDYARSSGEAIKKQADALGLSEAIITICHDIRRPLPFEDDSFDGCYSHMLYCMALTTPELEGLSREVWRVLKPEGLNVYTVRHTGDPHYRTGVARGDDMYESSGGFIVHFFSIEKVERLAKDFKVMSIDEFEEGPFLESCFA